MLIDKMSEKLVRVISYALPPMLVIQTVDAVFFAWYIDFTYKVRICIFLHNSRQLEH